MKLVMSISFILVLTGCVSGAPKLTTQQVSQLKNIQVVKKGEEISKGYKVISEVSAADCSGAPYGGRIWGDAERAIHTLKAKAVVLEADAVIETSCSDAPFVNNCWAAKLCSGKAVKWEQT